MNASEIRQKFLKFFEDKGHTIVSSAPIVLKNDPSLMFTNAGMNQFKDVFLGNQPAPHPRVANTQKCLRVSGKHNDLEEVGYDTYHHTMFEMLGNWSFGDYFKTEAIDWAWEFLTGTLQLDPEILYATVFEGSNEEGIPFDEEAYTCWLKHLPAGKIIKGNRKDNFWEMGDTGPCGPSSEIHIDLRTEKERQETPGHLLVNTGNPKVIEIWNLVFIQFNRKANGLLEPLPMIHVDTGMGFERLCRVVQKKDSNYDTDLFRPIIEETERITGFRCGKDEKNDIAMRVIADHLRAISFCIADGQLPSNIKAGYVLRRILRRAVRYGYTFLNQEEPFIYKLVPALVAVMGETFPEIKKQQTLVMKVVEEEENSFLRTLATGIRLLEQIMDSHKESKIIPGNRAFELYDTYGFPLDLTELIAREHGFTMDRYGFEQAMDEQKKRSRNATIVETGDWNIVHGNSEEGVFTGYDTLEEDVLITRYRVVKVKNKEQVHLVLNKTPFYAESGGQVGDSGTLTSGTEQIRILNTFHENNLILHQADRLPTNPESVFHARVDEEKRKLTACNHSATHLLHYALRQVLGTHVEQKGSLVEPERLRFDFSHFKKMTSEEIRKTEQLVNEIIRRNVARDEIRSTTLDKAREMGAIALFGEKYGSSVRVIRFGESVELCGGTHVNSTASIGLFKITTETSIAAGVRRIEAVTGKAAEDFINERMDLLDTLLLKLNNPKNPVAILEQILNENTRLRKIAESFHAERAARLQKELLSSAARIGEIRMVTQKIQTDTPALLKDITFPLVNASVKTIVLLGTELDGKAHLALMISNDLVKGLNLNAAVLIKELASEINGGGGGQPFFATAGGTNPGGLNKAFQRLKAIVETKLAN
mgnify:FL=1